MKQLQDGTEVPEHCYHYALAFKDNDGSDMLYHIYGRESINALSGGQFWNYLHAAVNADMQKYYKPK